jgi:hypothetical protein
MPDAPVPPNALKNPPTVAANTATYAVDSNNRDEADPADMTGGGQIVVQAPLPPASLRRHRNQEVAMAYHTAQAEATATRAVWYRISYRRSL